MAEVGGSFDMKVWVECDCGETIEFTEPDKTNEICECGKVYSSVMTYENDCLGVLIESSDEKIDFVDVVF